MEILLIEPSEQEAILYTMLIPYTGDNKVSLQRWLRDRKHSLVCCLQP